MRLAQLFAGCPEMIEVLRKVRRIHVTVATMHLFGQEERARACARGADDCRFLIEWLTNAFDGTRTDQYALTGTTIFRLLAFFEPERDALNAHFDGLDLNFGNPLFLLGNYTLDWTGERMFHINVSSSGTSGNLYLYEHNLNGYNRRELLSVDAVAQFIYPNHWFLQPMVDVAEMQRVPVDAAFNGFIDSTIRRVQRRNGVSRAEAIGLLQMRYDPYTCAACGSYADKRCINCTTRYCCRGCQQEDWEEHRIDCP